MSVDLKSRILRLLKEDEEFRYAVAGLIGLEDLRRGQAELREAVAGLAEGQRRLSEAVAGLIEGQKRLNEVVTSLVEGQKRLAMEQLRLVEEQRRLAEEQGRMWRTLRHVTRYIEEVSITLEEEARSMIELRLKQRGIQIKLDALIRPYVELDIYGSDEGLSILGETKTRLAPRHVREFERKLELIGKHEPELMRGKIIKTIYAMWAHPEAIEECRARGIWLNTPNKELTEFR